MVLLEFVLLMKVISNKKKHILKLYFKLKGMKYCFYLF